MDGAAKKTSVPAGSGSAEPTSAGDPAGGEVSIDVEQLQREARAFVEQMIDWVGRDTPEGRAMLGDLDREMTPIPRPVKAEPEETQPQSGEASVDRPTRSSSAHAGAKGSGSIPSNRARQDSASGVDPVEHIDVEQLRHELDPDDLALINYIGRDTPQAQELLRNWKRSQAAIPRPAKAEPEETQLIDLRLLKPSPLHHRTEPSSEELTALARSIEANGLINPIEVRPAGDKFEIIRGHRRVEAYRTLLGLPKPEQAKYMAIRAKVLPASDAEAVHRGIAEDLMREEFSAGDASRSIGVLQELAPQLNTAEKVSEATGVRPRRVRRYLQLGKAPAVVQEAALNGMLVDVDQQGESDGETGEGQRQERRKLDLSAALEFSRLHEALSAKKARGTGKAADSVSDGGGETDADRQTRAAIERALTENWGYREVKRCVDKAIGALGAAPKKKVSGRPRVPFKWEKPRLQVDVDLLDALDTSQKAELRTVIEDILRRL